MGLRHVAYPPSPPPPRPPPPPRGGGGRGPPAGGASCPHQLLAGPRERLVWMVLAPPIKTNPHPKLPLSFLSPSPGPGFQAHHGPLAGSPSAKEGQREGHGKPLSTHPAKGVRPSR